MTVEGLAGPVRLWATLKTHTKSAFQPAESPLDLTDACASTHHADDA
jgi:hypothetical protein